MSLDSDIRHLGQVPILGRLDYDARRLLAFSADNKVLHAGDVLFRRGDKSDSGYFVASGSIALDYSQDDSRRVQIIGAGSLIGEMALIVETDRSATAVAREPSRALKLSRTLFLRVLEEYPEAAASIRAAIAARLRGFVGELQSLRKIEGG